MKKLITILLCILLYVMTANAATYYVNTSLATGNNDGSSWSNAFKTFDAAATAATNNAGVDNVYIKGSFSKSSAWNISVDNYYGSFAGTESSPADRPLNDNDGNGIIESWEFKYPTTFTSTNNATAINGSAAILDGFTITHTGTVNSATAMTTLISPIGQTVQNCVFTGSTLSYGATTAYTNGNGGCLLKVLGTFQNNLIEKNNVTITYTTTATGSTDLRLFPILEVNLPSSGSLAVQVSSCIFRNNKVAITNNGTAGTVDNLRGMILTVNHPNTAGLTGISATFSDCIIHNNEASYTGTIVSTKSAIATSLVLSSSSSLDNFINCIFANNKSTNIVSCFVATSTGNVVHKAYNNVFWNNQNNSTGVSIYSQSAQNASTVFNNNYLDISKLGSWGSAWGANNQTNLSTSNTGANSPLFKAPPLSSGSNIIGSFQSSGTELTAINQADWRITASTSYLYHVGAATGTTGISTDKAGLAFISANPSVGAYEATPILSTSSVSSIASTTATSGGTISFDGGSSITTTGVCWSTSQNPTTANSKTMDGATSGTFTGNMTGLIGGTTYYVRAYATNANHTAYGMQTSFATSSSKPEPTNQVTNFATGTITSSAIPLTFTAAAAGSQSPDGYLIKMSTASVTDPVDGTDPADLTTLTGGVANVKATISPVSSFSGLSAGTLYHYKIYSYTNFGTDINFNTTSAPSLDMYTSTNPVTGVALTPTSSTTADISWTAASGYNATNHSTLVFVKASASAITLGSPTYAPSSYTASTVLTAGSTGTAYQGDGSAYCVYNGDGTNVSITGLTGNTTYQVLVYTVVDASNTGGANSYSSGATASGLTYKKEPVSSPTNFAKGTVSSSAISITWTASVPNSQGPDGYLLIGKQGSSISTTPTDGVDPTDVTAFTSGLANVKITPGSATSASSFTNMTAGTMYYYRIYPYTNSGTHIDYKTGNNTSLQIATSPNPVTGVNISSIDATNMTVGWTTPISNSATNHGIYVFVKAASAITEGTPTLPAYTTYTANTVFGSGTAYQGDASAYCVYKGDGNSVSISGLSVNTTYYVLIYSVFDNNSGSYNNTDGTNSYSISATTSATTGNPIINGAATATAFTTTYGTASTTQTFSVSGSYLSSSISATAPTGFEVSSDGTTYASYTTILRSGSVASGTLYVRLKADANVSGSYDSKNIVLECTPTTVNITTASSGNSVSPKGLTISSASAVNKVYDGNNSATITGTLSGVINSDDVTLSGTGTFNDNTVGDTKAVTSTSSLGGAKANNYSLTQPTSLTANIYPVTSTFSKNGISNWSSATEWTYTPLAATDLVISSGELIIDQTPITVNSITVNPGGKLTLASGKTLIAGTIMLQSDGTNGTATFVDNGGTLSASATVQQYLTGGRNWYISSPLSGATSTVFSATNSNPLYYYDETAAINASANAWTQIKTTGTALTPTTGYVANMDATVLSNQSNVVTFTGGSLNTGNISTGQNGVPALTYTDNNYKKGFNLVGNPYPSYLDWDNVTKANVMGSIWLRTKVSNTYLFDTYNASGQLGTSNSGIPVNNHIPPMQAFWVRATSSGASLSFDNSMRSHKGSQTTGSGETATTINDRIFKAPATIALSQSVLRLQVSNGTLSDEAILYSNPNALNSFDDYDTPKMFVNSTSVAEIYTLAGQEQLAINGLSTIPTDTEIPLGFTSGTAGTFSIKASQFSNFEAGTRIILKDYADQNNPIVTDLTDGSSYSFGSGATSNNISRFTLTFRAPSVATGINPESNSNLWISSHNGQVVLNGAAKGASLEVFNTVGQKVISKNITESTVQLKNNLAAGAYLVKVSNAGKTITRKIIID